MMNPTPNLTQRTARPDGQIFVVQPTTDGFFNAWIERPDGSRYARVDGKRYASHARVYLECNAQPVDR